MRKTKCKYGVSEQSHRGGANAAGQVSEVEEEGNALQVAVKETHYHLPPLVFQKKALQALKSPKIEPDKPILKRPARDAREVARKVCVQLDYALHDY